jgi:hypothetical protein
MAWSIDTNTYGSDEERSPGFRLTVRVTGGYPFVYDGEDFLNTASCADMLDIRSEAEAAAGPLVRRAAIDLVFRCPDALDDMLAAVERDLAILESFENS